MFFVHFNRCLENNFIIFCKNREEKRGPTRRCGIPRAKKPPAPKQGGEKTQVRTGGSASVKGHPISAQHLPAGDGGDVLRRAVLSGVHRLHFFGIGRKVLADADAVGHNKLLYAHNVPRRLIILPPFYHAPVGKARRGGQCTIFYYRGIDKAFFHDIL